MTGNKWTSQDIQTLTKLYKQNISIQKIADVLHRTKSAISTQLHKLHLTSLSTRSTSIHLQYKIINNTHIKKPAFYIYVIDNNQKMGLSIYCKLNHISTSIMKQMRDFLLQNEEYEITTNRFNIIYNEFSKGINYD